MIRGCWWRQNRNELLILTYHHCCHFLRPWRTLGGSRCSFTFAACLRAHTRSHISGSCLRASQLPTSRQYSLEHPSQLGCSMGVGNYLFLRKHMPSCTTHTCKHKYLSLSLVKPFLSLHLLELIF